MVTRRLMTIVVVLALLVAVGFITGWLHFGQASGTARLSRAPSAQPATSGAGALSARTRNAKSPIPTQPPSSAGPVILRVVASPTPAPAQPATVLSGSQSPAPLATITPQAQPSIVMARNGLPEGVPYAGEHDPVRIDSVTLSADEVRGGDIASARVITTSNAAALTARIGTYQISVPRVAPGIFS